MDTELLVEDQIEVGKKVVNQLALDGFEVSVAFWGKEHEDGSWRLYVASPSVKLHDPGSSYPSLYASLVKIPDVGIQLGEIRLLNDQNKTAIAMKQLRDRHAIKEPFGYGRYRLGQVDLYEATLYPSGNPDLIVSVNYLRKGPANRWKSWSRQEGFNRAISANGAVAYLTTTDWDDDEGKEAPRVTITVLVEVDLKFEPMFNEVKSEYKNLIMNQAEFLADHRFQSSNPGAVIVRDHPWRS